MASRRAFAGDRAERLIELRARTAILAPDEPGRRAPRPDQSGGIKAVFQFEHRVHRLRFDSTLAFGKGHFSRRRAALPRLRDA